MTGSSRWSIAPHTCALALGASLACAPSSPSTVSMSTWIQVWSDEFDGAAGARVDSMKWRHDTADGCAAGNCGWGNNEKEYYTDAPENIALNGQGQLLIVARQAPAGLTCYYGPCRYTSAKIMTRGKVDVAPGRRAGRVRPPLSRRCPPPLVATLTGRRCGT